LAISSGEKGDGKSGKKRGSSPCFFRKPILKKRKGITNYDHIAEKEDLILKGRGRSSSHRSSYKGSLSSPFREGDFYLRQPTKREGAMHKKGRKTSTRSLSMLGEKRTGA